MADPTSWPFSEKSLAVALMVVARYLAEHDPRFVDYVEASIERAMTTGLGEADLTFLRTVLEALRAAST